MRRRARERRPILGQPPGDAPETVPAVRRGRFTLGTNWNGARPKPVMVDGIKFDSSSEARRYGTLRMLALAGEVRNLECHVKIPMIVNGAKIGRGWMSLDFRYERFRDGAWRLVHEEHKPVDTRESKQRRMVAEAANGITIEVTP